MTNQHLVHISPDHEDDLKAEARASMFFALRNAFKKRSDEYNVRAKDIAEALGKDKGYVSRVLNGSSGSIDFETLIVFLEALGYHLPLDPVSYEDLRHKKVNFDARPSGINFEVDTNQSSVLNASTVSKNTKHVWSVDYSALADSAVSSPRVAKTVRFKTGEQVQ